MARGFCPQLRGAGTICKPGSKGDDSPCLLCGVRDHDTEVAPRPEPGRLEREYGYVTTGGSGVLAEYVMHRRARHPDEGPDGSEWSEPQYVAPPLPPPVCLWDQVTITTTAGCPGWVHERQPRLEGVQGIVYELRDGAQPPFETSEQHVYRVAFQAPQPNPENGGPWRAGLFSASELHVVKRQEPLREHPLMRHWGWARCPHCSRKYRTKFHVANFSRNLPYLPKMACFEIRHQGMAQSIFVAHSVREYVSDREALQAMHGYDLRRRLGIGHVASFKKDEKREPE